MNGILYGVGVGPGDPELLTLKAVRVIKECEAVLFPGTQADKCTALKIAADAVPEIYEKELIGIPMPMTKDVQILENSHRDGADSIRELLENGKNCAFLTLGDPTIYSTYIYLHKRITAMGYTTEIINGIPSFCAAAARLNTGLVESKESLHVFPASYPIDAGVKYKGTKVYMKAGKKLKELRENLGSDESDGSQLAMVENCGMDGEKVYIGRREIPEKAGYYSLIIEKK